MDLSDVSRGILQGTALSAKYTCGRLLDDCIRANRSVKAVDYTSEKAVYIRRRMYVIKHIEEVILPSLEGQQDNKLRPWLRKWLKFYSREYLGLSNGCVRVKEADELVLDDFLKSVGLRCKKMDYHQRIMMMCKYAHENGWFMVFDTLTVAPHKVKEFEEKGNVIRDYCRRVNRAIAYAMGYSSRNMPNGLYTYICVPEYGSLGGRLHFHILHFCKDLPLNTVDPNLGRERRNRVELSSFKEFWQYGYTKPIMVRYRGDAYGLRKGYLWPVDANKCYRNNDFKAIGFYLVKYVVKSVEYKENMSWQEKKTILKPVRISMKRMFGLDNLYQMMTQVSDRCLKELMTIHWTVTPVARLVRLISKRIMRLRLDGIPVEDLDCQMKRPMQIYKLLLDLMRDGQSLSLSSLEGYVIPKLKSMDISDETERFLRQFEDFGGRIPIGCR